MTLTLVKTRRDECDLTPDARKWGEHLLEEVLEARDVAEKARSRVAEETHARREADDRVAAREQRLRDFLDRHDLDIFHHRGRGTASLTKAELVVAGVDADKAWEAGLAGTHLALDAVVRDPAVVDEIVQFLADRGLTVVVTAAVQKSDAEKILEQYLAGGLPDGVAKVIERRIMRISS